MGHDLTDMAEMLLFGLDENDKVEAAEILKEVSTDEKVVIAIETDTGEQFFAEVIRA
jgi:hypothetical protein